MVIEKLNNLGVVLALHVFYLSTIFVHALLKEVKKHLLEVGCLRVDLVVF